MCLRSCSTPRSQSLACEVRVLGIPSKARLQKLEAFESFEFQIQTLWSRSRSDMQLPSCIGAGPGAHEAHVKLSGSSTCMSTRDKLSIYPASWFHPGFTLD